ncbi:MAG: aminoglycoside phosphotransferase family protein [Clostridiales bacterium]|nr:aminoglycoside phosphotransferase family protein [Clostridiales bacterium]
MDILAIASNFRLSSKAVTAQTYGRGHINDTFRVTTQDGGSFILQKINKTVFKDPGQLMKNVTKVIQFLRERSEDPREVMNLVNTVDGKQWYVDSEREYWRVYDFVPGSMSLDACETEHDFYECAVAFGRFQKRLAMFDASMLKETIPHFHDTPDRYAQLLDAIVYNPLGRVKDAQREIDFALKRENYAHTLMNLQSTGVLPLRVTHNDTKLNNVLFDSATRKALCVIDLDTVMPGLAVNDFGDAIRFGASTAAEDEKDLDKVEMSLTLYGAFVEGYLSACALNESEKEHLRDGAKMMTLECGVRFLTDYINGDVYFRVRHEGQNLDRCRTQFKLVRDMDKKWDEMAKFYIT